MTVFISHSHQDSDFVDNLAKNLAQLNVHVWVDRWELNLGDSLIDNIQRELGEADAVIVVVSQHSVDSEWCRKELNTALTRELGERRVVVLPCVIDDCEVPLFLKDKLYADFYRTPDKAWSLVQRALSPLINPNQSRVESENPKYFTDWSVNWALNPSAGVIVRFVQHAPDWPYSILLEMRALSTDAVSHGCLSAALITEEDRAIVPILEALSDITNRAFPENVIVKDVKPIQGSSLIAVEPFGNLEVQFEISRMGDDNGMDTLVHVKAHIQNALAHYKTVTASPT